MKKPRRGKYEPPQGRHHRLLLLTGLPETLPIALYLLGDERDRRALVAALLQESFPRL
jgi:hypothetical protein